MRDDWRPTGCAFVGIDTRDSDAAATQFLANHGMTWPSLIDDDGSLLLAFRGKVNPQRGPGDARHRPAGSRGGARPRRASRSRHPHGDHVDRRAGAVTVAVSWASTITDGSLLLALPVAAAAGSSRS